MNKKEFAKVMAFISAAIDRDIAENTFSAYYEILKDMDFELCFAAAKKVVAEDEYPTLPTIGKIRKAAYSLCNMGRLTPGEAWGLVLSAIRRHGIYGEPDAIRELPQDVAHLAGQMGWRELCHSERPDVIRAQFMRMYEAQAEKKKELDMLPKDVKRLVQGVGQKMLAEEAGK